MNLQNSKMSGRDAVLVRHTPLSEEALEHLGVEERFVFLPGPRA